jgi:UDP-2,3-diacylglucosamine pyrophosphatase LpxH
VKGKDYIDKYENDIVGYCIQQDKKYNGIICGHIHHANIRQFGKMTYMCCGDWCDTCSAIFEKNGVYCLEKY